MVYDPQNKPVNPYASTYENFIEQTRDHSLTVILDNGLNRQLHVGAPDTGIWSWRVATWPGYLATFGDIADGFMFTRIEDMIDFFDRGGHGNYYADGSPSIDFRYWAEKLSGGRAHDQREYSSDSFIQHVIDKLDEHDELGSEAQAEYEKIVEVAKRVCARHGIDYDAFLAELRTEHLDHQKALEAVKGIWTRHGVNHEEYLSDLQGTRSAQRLRDLEIDENNDDEAEFFGMPIPQQSPAERRGEILAEARSHADDEKEAREWLRNNQNIFGQDAYWDWELRDYNVHFIFACYAIELTVRLWRHYEASPQAKAHRNPADSYILVEDGQIKNDPEIPVFDLNVLNYDSPDKLCADEVLSLYERITGHPQACHNLTDPLSRAAEFVRAHGSAKAIQTIDSHEERRLAGRVAEKVA